ncbi:acyl-CoA synthetase (AMP-forming)/AMP-acid ligase II [Xenococcus sp. PCC 7305]|uniref:2-succinylbenzoate--CoA ligase n=1 Tax=Xenococcus sp. PCC 7305 TaxID=102125 RepID=UPI0002AC7479|nr:2-succinylbenzoate--CoA ligase [Xenococcus sp. PCC 7305]ELS04498.1 acyl-CoA synthetase (AMP-forming)/AMP-acid ligase II [Xenococcus sp. PCC 7305]
MNDEERESLFENLQEWENSQGLVGFSSYNLSRSLQEFSTQLQDLKSQTKTIPKIILVESDPPRFIVYFFAAILSGVDLFICDPNWQNQEWKQVFNLVNPDLIWGTDLNTEDFSQQDRKINLRRKDQEQYIIGISTGGSSGKIRFATHTLSSMSASVSGFTRYFAIAKVNACCTLPLYHISGLIQLWRCFMTQGKLAIFPYQALKQGQLPDISPEKFFISLVPTQLKFLLDSNPDWLTQFHSVLLGGAPPWRSLIEQARDYKINLSPTYGMTETASGVVYLKSQDFLNHNNSSGQVLPHAQVGIIDQQGKRLNPGQIGTIKIKADSLHHGYYPNFRTTKTLITDDLGYLDGQGFLYIVGRKSQKIITGGKNVFPAAVENAILATKLVQDVCVIGLEDEQWGQIITAVYVPRENFNLDLLKQKLQSQLSKYKHPKNWVKVNSLQRSDRGKINYLKLTQIAQKKLQS